MPATSSPRALQVLLVEDSPTDRFMAAEALAQCGIVHGLHDVSNGVDAMSFLRREGKFLDAPRPDIILLDLNLPKKDGREVLAEVKSDPLLKLIPVVVLTTSRSDEDLMSAYGNHASSYIAKPLDFPQFKAALHALGIYWFELVTLPNQEALSRFFRPAAGRVTPLPGQAQTLLRVLLVEDSATDGMLLRHALAESPSLRFELTQATRIEDAHSRLTSEPFDIVMVDLGLPDCHGLESYRKVRAIAPSMPVIVLTGLDDELTGISALREGAQDYLVKGELSAPALSRAVRYAIDRKQQEEQLRQAQRLEAVAQLAGGVANDFNNILGVVRGNTELITSAEDMAEIAHCAREIQQAADRAMVLARQLLTFSRQQPLHLEALDLNRLVQDFAPILVRALGEGVRLGFSPATDATPVRADASLLEQALLTLAMNAQEAMSGAGELRLETSQVYISPAVARRHSEAYAGRFVQLSLFDTGRGMSPAVLQRIFEPFFSTKTAGQGKGIGLPTVYGIVQQHRGWLEVKTRPGFGTRFDIFLPLAEGSVEERPSPSPQAEPGTVLVVEDEHELRRLICRALRARGYQVLEAGSVAEALAVWAESSESIDLLLTDMVLPAHQTGKQLAEALAVARPALKIIFMSGYSPDFNTAGFVLEEGVNFLQKPFPLARLIETIRLRLADGPPQSMRRPMPS